MGPDGRPDRPQADEKTANDARGKSIVSGAQLIDLVLGKPPRRLPENSTQQTKQKSFGGVGASANKVELKLALHESEIKGLRIDNQLLLISQEQKIQELRTANDLLQKSQRQEIERLERRIAELPRKSRPTPEGTLDEKRNTYRQDEVAKMLALGARQVRNYLNKKKLTRAARKGWVLNDEKLRSLCSSVRRTEERKGGSRFSGRSR